VCTILVIDDEPSISEMLDRALSRFGYKVLVAATAKQGLSMFDEVSVDLVLTDYQMPGLTGLDVVKHVRHSKRSHTPVIAMSGTPAMMKPHAFDLVLAKPFSIYDLLAHVRSICPKDSEPGTSCGGNS
jgi:DNA-binding response OmpR family regulator